MTTGPRTKERSFTNIRTGWSFTSYAGARRRSQVCREKLYFKLGSFPSGSPLCYKHIKSMLTHCNKLMQIVQRCEGLHNKDPYITAHGGLAAVQSPTRRPLIHHKFTMKHKSCYFYIIYSFGQKRFPSLVHLRPPEHVCRAPRTNVCSEQQQTFALAFVHRLWQLELIYP